MEQNLVQYLVDQAFQDQNHQVYKKSVKTGPDGKFLELSFLSPEVGRRYGDLLRHLADETKWPIRISDSVNQKEIFQFVQLLCGKYDLVLRQNPSYLPQRRVVQIKVLEPPAPQVCQTLAQEVEETTGLACVITG